MKVIIHIYKYVKSSEKCIIVQLTAMNCLLAPRWFVNKKALLESFSIQGILNYAVKAEMSVKEFNGIVKCYKDIIIYRVGQMGEVISQYLQTEMNITICNFAVTGIKKYLNGIAVKPIEKLLNFINTGLFVVAAAEPYRKKIEDDLKEWSRKYMLY